MYFQSQYQQQPIPLEGGLIKREWLRFYEPHQLPSQSTFSGEHEGIVDREVWDQAQELLAQNRQGPTKGARAKSGSMSIIGRESSLVPSNQNSRANSPEKALRVRISLVSC